MQLKQVLLLVAALAWRVDARAVAPDDVKGIKTLQPDEARDDPFFDHNPQYDFAYRIHDEETGDAKDQTEERRGDAVHGSYSVVDPDGTLRVVKYTADDEHGFNAVVSLTPGHSKPIVPVVKAFARGALPRKDVAQHHIDVPVPVQHHVLTSSSSQQVLDSRRVLVQHPTYQTGVLKHQHFIQPPFALGVHQDVHHLIPQNAYQLHRIHQVPGSGIHHQTLPLVPEVQVQEQQQDVVKLHEQLPTPMIPQQEQSLLQQQEAVTAQQQEPRRGVQQGLQHVQQQGIQQDILQQTLQQNLRNDLQQGFIQQGALQHGLQQQGLQPGILQQVFVQPGLQQDLPEGLLHQGIPRPVLQQGNQQDVKQNAQQGLQQDPQQGVQQGNLEQDLHQGALQQEQQGVLSDQQDNKLQQSKTDPNLPVVDLRQSEQNVQTGQQEHQQLRSLDGEEQGHLQVQHEVQQVPPQLQQVHQVHHEVQRMQQAIPHQRTFAVYRTTATSAGAQGTNFITFNSPYAHYTIS